MKRHTAIAFATLALYGPCVSAERQNTAVNPDNVVQHAGDPDGWVVK